MHRILPRAAGALRSNRGSLFSAVACEVQNRGRRRKGKDPVYDSRPRSSYIVRCEVQDGGRVVQLLWDSGKQTQHDSRALRLAAPDARHETTQRRLFPDSTEVRSARLENAECIATGVRLHWQSGLATELSSMWLHRHTTDADDLEAESFYRSRPPHDQSPPMPEVEWDAVCGGDEEAIWRWMEALGSVGVCIVRNVPKEEGTVMKAAGLIAPPMRTLYPSPFDVRIEERPINIAYTPEPLVLHQDLAYYESPPAMQLLHCIQREIGVTDGENVLLDAHQAAEILRERSPEHFATLCRVPATFQKDHLAREHPAQMWYHRPHVSVNADGHIIAVFWAPPFEGELRAAAKDVGPYFDAYEAFADIINSKEAERRCGWRLLLHEGDLLIFNNRRLLHGREGISGSGRRWLQGCYLSADDFQNRFRNLARKFANPIPDDCPEGAFGGRGVQERWGFNCWR